MHKREAIKAQSIALHGRRKRTSLEASECKRFQLRQEQRDKYKNGERIKTSSSSFNLPSQPWSPQLHFNASDSDLEIWRKIGKLEPGRDLVCVGELHYIVQKGLLGSCNLETQRRSLAILCEATKKQDGCEEVVKYLPDLYKLATNYNKVGLEVSLGCIGIIGNLAMENEAICRQLLPCLAALASLIQPSTPPIITRRLMQLLVDARFFPDLVPIILPVVLRTIDKKDDAVVMQATMRLFNNILQSHGEETRARFLAEHKAFVSKLLPIYAQGNCLEAMMCIETLSCTDSVGMELHKMGFSEAAFKLLAGQKHPEDAPSRLYAATLLNNLYACEDIAPLLPNASYLPAIASILCKDRSAFVRSECSHLLLTALSSTNDSLLLPDAFVLSLLETLAQILQQEADATLLENTVEMLDYFYESPRYRVHLFDNETLYKAVETGLERLEKLPSSPDLSLKAAKLLEKIEQLEKEREEDEYENSTH